jgi:drug/metabolite transporter (DMT)-like permease
MAWILVIVTTAGLSIGQLLFKRGALAVNANADQGLIAWINLPLISGVALYAVCTIAWIGALRLLPLRLAYPIAALSYVIVPLLAHVFLDEPLTARTMLGGAVIIAGVIIATWEGVSA